MEKQISKRSENTLGSANNRRRAKSAGLRIWRIVMFFIIFGLSFLILNPFITKIFMGFMDPNDLLDPQVRMIPKNPSVVYWKVALEGMELGRTLLPSLFMSLVVSVIQLFSSAFIGYGLGRFKFRLRKLFIAMVIAVMLVPPQIYSIAQYLRFYSLDLIDSPIPLFSLAFAGMGLKQGLYIYLFMVFYRGLPTELESAAYIDGAGPFKTFFSVILPNARNIIATVVLFSFAWQWTDLSYPQLYLPTYPSITPLIGNIYVRVGADADAIGSSIAQNAACILLLIPLIALFMFAQKYLNQSLSRSGQAN